MTIKQLRLLEKNAVRERELIKELNALVADIDRSEKKILDLQQELAEVNSKFQGPRNTQQDIDYLSALLNCARKKLIWEKQIASLRKRTPLILQEITELLKDPQVAPTENTRSEMLDILQKVQTAMERLSAASGPPE